MLWTLLIKVSQINHLLVLAGGKTQVVFLCARFFSRVVFSGGIFRVLFFVCYTERYVEIDAETPGLLFLVLILVWLLYYIGLIYMICFRFV